MKHIFYLMGKSASGKDTFYKRLLEDKDLKLKKIVLYSTRPIREGEVDKETYNFVDDAEFKRLQRIGKVIESRTYKVIGGEWSYFTVDDGSIDLDTDDYLVIGTLESYEQMIKYYGKNVMIPVYINVENGLRLKRAIAREERQEFPRYEEMCRRFLADEQDFSEENLAKNGITRIFENIDFEKCYREIADYIQEYR